MQSFKNVLVVPYRPKSGAHSWNWVGGPIWPDWDGQTDARFNRLRTPVDVRPDDAPPEDTVDVGDAFWIGPLHNHFGHFLQDFATRILDSFNARAGAVLVFAVGAGQPIATLADTPGWFRQILDWYGVPDDRVRLVTRPTVFRRLSVVPQPEQFKVPPSADFLDRLDRLVASKGLPAERAGALYVSRAGQVARFAGESYLETALAAAGVRVLRPETRPIAEQVAAYLGAERLIFAEGSALHGLHLVGRGVGDIDVLCRRNKRRHGDWLLEPRARSVTYHFHVRGQVDPLKPNGKRFEVRSMPFLDMDALVDALEARGLPLRRHWDEAAWRAAAVQDIRAWLQWAAERKFLRSPEQRRHVRAGIVRAGFPELRSAIVRIARREAEGRPGRGEAPAEDHAGEAEREESTGA